jgi:hypothetical protein
MTPSGLTARPHRAGAALLASRSFAVLLAALALAVLCGCPAAVVRPDQPWQDAEAALRAHASMRRRLTSLRGEARVDQRGEDGGRVRGTVVLLVQRPDRVRFDAMTQFGPAAVLTSDGARFAFADFRERRYLHGPTCPENIGRLLGIPLSGEQVGTLLLGGTPRIVASASAIEVDAATGHYVVSLRGAGGLRQRIELGIREADRRAPPGQQRLRLLRSELFDPRGGLVWRVTYDDYRVVPLGEMGVAMPYEVRFEHPAQGTDTIMRFRELVPNPDLDPEVFHQGPIPGLADEEVPCGAP